MSLIDEEAKVTIYLPGDDIPPPGTDDKFVFVHPTEDPLTEEQERRLEEVGARLKAEYGPDAPRIIEAEIEAENI